MLDYLHPNDPRNLADDDERPRCRCTHNTRNPELGCTCGYADWLSDNALDDFDIDDEPDWFDPERDDFEAKVDAGYYNEVVG